NVTYTPTWLEGLTASLRVGQSGSNQSQEVYEPPYLHYNFIRGGNNGQLYTNELDPANPSQWGNAPDNARIRPVLGRSSSYQGTLTLNYSKTLGKHGFSVLAGGERSESNNENMEIYWNNQFIANISEFWAFDLGALTFRSRNKGEGIKQSFFGQFRYNFD